MKKNKFLKILIILCGIFFLEGALHFWGKLYLSKFYSERKLKEKIDPESQVILCLGESSTTGIWVPPGDSYPAQLERMLRAHFGSLNIHVVVPPHIGQNTSQMANRIRQYIEVYEPKAILMMVGCNNHWSLAESNIIKFMPSNSGNAIRMKMFIFFNRSHLFKLTRYFYLAVKYKSKTYVEGLNFKKYLAGAPQRMSSDPPHWVLNYFDHNAEQLLKLWQHDAKAMMRIAKEADTPILLMTYPRPIIIPTEEFVTLAKEENSILIRNDLDFERLKESGDLEQYIFPKDHWHPTGKGYTIVAQNAFKTIIDNEFIK